LKNNFKDSLEKYLFLGVERDSKEIGRVTCEGEKAERMKEKYYFYSNFEKKKEHFF